MGGFIYLRKARNIKVKRNATDHRFLSNSTSKASKIKIHLVVVIVKIKKKKLIEDLPHKGKGLTDPCGENSDEEHLIPKSIVKGEIRASGHPVKKDLEILLIQKYHINRLGRIIK